MMKTLYRPAALAVAIVVTASLGACVDPYYAQRPVYGPAYGTTYGPSYGPAYGPAPVAQPAPLYGTPAPYVEYGRVSNIEVLQSEARRSPSGAGAIIGGVLGAVVGNQIGRGTGRALATGVGVVGGAVAGNQLEGNQRGGVVQTFRVSVDIENGGYRVYDVPSPGDLRIGDRVRVQNGQLQRV